MKNSLLTLVVIILIMLSCKTEKEVESTLLKVDLIGSWEYLGFGRSIIIGDSIVQKFHLSSKGNVQLSDSKRKNYVQGFHQLFLIFDHLDFRSEIFKHKFFFEYF